MTQKAVNLFHPAFASRICNMWMALASCPARRGTLSSDDEEVEQQVAARMARQRIFDQPDPPNQWIVLDEVVLHRLIGTAKTMYDQLLQVADMSMRSYICVQVVPASTGVHAGLVGSFYIASVRGKPDILYMDAVEGVTIERSALVRKAPRCRCGKTDAPFCRALVSCLLHGPASGAVCRSQH
jgi:hypothetical protein